MYIYIYYTIEAAAGLQPVPRAEEDAVGLVVVIGEARVVEAALRHGEAVVAVRPELADQPRGWGDFESLCGSAQARMGYARMSDILTSCLMVTFSYLCDVIKGLMEYYCNIQYHNAYYPLCHHPLCSDTYTYTTISINPKWYARIRTRCMIHTCKRTYMRVPCEYTHLCSILPSLALLPRTRAFDQMDIYRFISPEIQVSSIRIFCPKELPGKVIASRFP